MARNGDEDSDARRGVQGVSSSAWLEIMNVPSGKSPSCQMGVLIFAHPLISFSGSVSFDRSPPFARCGCDCISNNGWGTKISCFRFSPIHGSKVAQVFRLCASKPQPLYPSCSSTSTSTPFPQPMSTKPGKFVSFSSCSPCIPASVLVTPYISFQSSIKKAAILRSSKTCLLGSVFSTQLSQSLFA